MAKVNAPIFSLNGGEVGEEALARLDLERLQFAGSLYQNVLPRVIGSMTLRPGMEHVTDLALGNVQLLEYSYSGGSSLLPILSNNEMRVVKDDAFVSRASVSTAITSGDFSSFTGWTDASSGNAVADVSGGNLRLLGTPQDTAIATQTISVALADRNVEHGLRINVARGPVTVRLGSSSGSADLINAIDLEDGEHSIAFTPTGASVYLQLSNGEARYALVDSCTIEAAGTMVIPTPWTSTDLSGNILRYTQHKDILYCASGVYQQREIQRRGNTSWGVQRHKVNDGPFEEGDGSLSLDPSGYTGSITVASNKAYFDSTMVGRLFRLYQGGQTVEETFSSAPAEGAYVRISGPDTNNQRHIAIYITGTWTGTVRLQIATDDGSGNPTGWVDLLTKTANYTNTDLDVDDDSNVIKYVRFALNTGDLTSGSVTTKIVYAGGSNYGIARVTSYTSSTQVSAEVLRRFYSLNATFEWDYSVWSDYDGWPAAVERFGGRLYWGKGDFIYGSVPDSYRSHDDTVEGDSAPIFRSVGSNTDRGLLWLLGLQRLIGGTDSSEISVKSSSFDEPLTAANWFPIESSTRGCAYLRPVKVDKDGIFVQQSGTGVFALVTEQGTLDYRSSDLTAMHEEVCDGYEIVDVAVQRRPDTVLWFVLSNGEARALTYDPAEKVIAWSRVVTAGTISRVAANRGDGQDNVYFVVTRNGTQRLEKLAKLSECRGAALNCLADGFTRFTATASQTDFSVPHLNGLGVTVWANGTALYDQDNLYTVASNKVVLPAQSAGTKVVIGLPYTGDYRSTKLAYGAQNGTALFQKKKVSQLGLYMLNTAVGKILAGKDFDTLRSITESDHNGVPLTSGQVLDTYDADLMPVSSDWNTDSRLCLRMKSPYPATIAAMVLDVKTNG